MFNPKHLINWAINPQPRVWIKATIIKETPKAIKILFGGKEIWLPKVWILRIKRSKIGHCEANEKISIKIPLYRWAKKF